MANLVTKEQLLEYHEQFKYFDKDNDGTITGSELMLAMKRMGQNPSDDEIRSMIAEVDENGDNKIDFTEFITMMVRQQAVEIFRNFDKDNSGTLSKTEVLNMLDTIFPKKFSIKDVEEKFSLIDGNTDGCINYEEFVKMIIPRVK